MTARMDDERPHLGLLAVGDHVGEVGDWRNWCSMPHRVEGDKAAEGMQLQLGTALGKEKGKGKSKGKGKDKVFNPLSQDQYG